MRDREYTPEKLHNCYRIVGIGDSLMFGWGVAQEEPYLTVLERQLNELPDDPRTFEALNFAVPGYNTTMEVSTFENKALRFGPDLVIIQFINNDFGVPLFMRKPREPLSPTQSHFLSFIGRRLGLSREAGVAGLVGSRLNEVEEEQREEVLAPYRYMLGESGYRRAMARLAELTAPRDIPVIVIRGSCSERAKRIVEDVAEEHGFHMVDMAPHTDRYVEKHGIPNTKTARRKALWVSAADHHPNARAHTIYADAVMEQMRELGIIGAERAADAR